MLRRHLKLTWVEVYEAKLLISNFGLNGVIKLSLYIVEDSGASVFAYV
jgi:hypothetical protein